MVLNVTIGKDGSTHDLHVIKGVDDAIDQAAISAVSQWKFEPATYEGNPVAVELRIEVNFRLETNASPTQGQPTSGNSEQIRNLYTDANEAYGRRDYQTAANLARRITSLSPQHNSAWNLLGISLLAMNQLDAAAAALETQIKIDAGSTFAYNNLGGRMRHRLGQPGQRPFRVGTGHQRFFRARHMEQRRLQSCETQHRTGACGEVV